MSIKKGIKPEELASKMLEVTNAVSPLGVGVLTDYKADMFQRLGDAVVKSVTVTLYFKEHE
jgi:hypothetical protein